MTVADSHSSEPNQRPASHGSGAKVKHAEWSLTEEALDKLLAAFSADRDEAAKLYENTHLKLARFFEWRACSDPEDRADKTFNRVARRVDEGQPVENLIGYIYGVARLVYMESLKEHERDPLLLDTVDDMSWKEPNSNDDERERRLRCLDQCLEELPPESRALILEYYDEEKQAKIEIRKRMATRLGIPLNALRIRAYRIRAGLEECVLECLDKTN